MLMLTVYPYQLFKHVWAQHPQSGYRKVGTPGKRTCLSMSHPGLAPHNVYICVCVCDYVCTKNTYVCILYKCMRVQKERFFIGTT